MALNGCISLIQTQTIFGVKGMHDTLKSKATLFSLSTFVLFNVVP